MNNTLGAGPKFGGNGSSKSSVLEIEEHTRQGSLGEIHLPPPMSIPVPATPKPAVIETIRRGEFTIFETYERFEGGMQEFLVWLAKHELFVLPDRDRIINGSDGAKIYRVIVDGKDEVVRDGIHRCRHYVVADKSGISLVLAAHREE